MAKPAGTVHGVLCDTSYFIRWAKPSEAFHPAAQDYLKFLAVGRDTQFLRARSRLEGIVP
jgi:hypothetical protein